MGQLEISTSILYIAGQGIWGRDGTKINLV